MPLWIPLALAGAKLAKSGFDYYQSVKRQKKATAAGELADTQTEAAQEAYLKHLGTQAKEGTVDVGGRLSGYSQDVYGGAQRASMSAKGQLIRSGMENSIAGIRATKEPFTKAGGMIGRKRLQLEGMNEETKRLAEERYAQSHLQFATQDTQRTEARTLQDINTTGQRNQALAGGLLSAGSTALSAFGPKAAVPGGGPGGIPKPGFDPDSVSPGDLTNMGSGELADYAKQRGLTFGEARKYQMDEWERMFKEGFITK